MIVREQIDSLRLFLMENNNFSFLITAVIKHGLSTQAIRYGRDKRPFAVSSAHKARGN